MNKPPQQTELDNVRGSPEGLYAAPPGYVTVDYVTGNWWLKTTAQELKTGWKMFTAGGAGAGVLVADTLIDLRAIVSNAANRVAVLAGELVAGDGNGGIYLWRTSGAADNPLVTVRPNDYGTQLWEKLL